MLTIRRSGMIAVLLVLAVSVVGFVFAQSSSAAGPTPTSPKPCRGNGAKACPTTTTTSTTTTTAPSTSGTSSTSSTTSPTTTSSTTTSPAATTTTTSPSTTSTTATTTTSGTTSPTTTSSTTTSPAPTTTTTAPATTGQLCTTPYFTTSGPNGGVSDGGYYVHNNLWNAASYPGTTGTTQVCSYHSWNHVGYAVNTGDGAVKTYPNVHKDLSGRSISSFTTLTSQFAHTSPGVGTYDVAYDLWLNGVPNDEVMIWTDNQKQTPAGTRVASNVALSGYTWDVYATSGNGYLAFVPSNGVRLTSGKIDLKAMLGYLVSTGRRAATDTVDQICYGVEVVDTAGAQRTWNVTNFDITMQ